MKRTINILLVLTLYGALTSCSDTAWHDSPDNDNESSQTSVDISNPKAWSLASVPSDQMLFPEASLKNDVAYGKNRALIAWYNIDRLFTQRNSAHAPSYIKNDLDALSYPYAREVAFNEIYPGRMPQDGESSVIQTLNLSFYPRERGPYNLDASNVDQDGFLSYPERRWGGIMRRIENPDFEQSNIKYIQFWMLDPFMDSDLDNHEGGNLYFNLGDVSEDILKDGLMSHENGLPIDGNTTYLVQTVWGKVYAGPKPTYAYDYDYSSSKRNLQDVGLDGLTNQEEFTHPSYAQFLNKLRTVLSESTFWAMLNDPFSPFNDPAGDNYAYYCHGYYDTHKFSILERYKHCNGSDGNSLPKELAADSQYQAWRSTPETEDINSDETLNEQENYFQYRIAIHPDSLQVGRNYITDLQVANVQTRNGMTQSAVWYQFTIPLADYQKKIGSISDFSNIRFMRIYMTGFRATTHLRFATLELVKGE